MPLYTFDNTDQRQPAVPSAEHWKLFTRFEGSPLHAALVARIQPFLEQGVIYSRQAGYKILGDLQANEQALLEGYDQEELGGLFGMTVWNCIAQQREDWFWYPDDSRDGERASTYFRRTKR